MKNKLDSDLESLLKVRVHLSRTLRVFHFRELLENWEISRSTLHRYTKPHLREYSREHARKVYEKTAGRDKTNCFRCKEALQGHDRCKDCTILMHNGNERCSSCIGTRLKRKLEALR